ncbi:hypothetical protein PBI_LUCKY2013_230 [Mycobacterium phage Lucky2013]|nr:hypothetical protein N857_gp190 [Mycobacterium phage Wanda]YP_009213458.1 hypothetical protein AVV70_gp196 [Mycobacterium phage MiaZeal]ASD50838.1 hypothetical protein PORCELAIN_234 [Mycobacterium phage Porcelain]ASD53621.1 hypothetical protein PBI_LUCKY2013_230 [Mycobacterium phage Lucky2013]ASZ74306.1 hypothetical protein SEA_SQUINT_231 [Mycobacterium phage Squint]ATN89946.1 hypothetical protein SEA_KLEIN_240 [Mycobacterium phage Klein]AIE57736.1 hypothetical protein PBI_WANDA_232 [Mycob
MDNLYRDLDKAVNPGKATFTGVLCAAGGSTILWAMLALIIWALS